MTQTARPDVALMPAVPPVAPAPAPALARAACLPDMRFAALIGAEGWARVPQAVKARFARRLLPGRAITYAGQMVECRMHPLGRWLAQACRLIGAPLPLDQGTTAQGMAAIVSVTEDGARADGHCGQVWTRVYARPRGFPQVIHSAKRFGGPTGLEEYLGGGFGIALRGLPRTAALPSTAIIISGSWAAGGCACRAP